MKILARTTPGREFMYSARSAHKVSARSADKICAIVNEYKHLLGTPAGECWHVYDVDQYDAAFQYAQYQAFTIRNGIVTARHW